MLSSPVITGWNPFRCMVSNNTSPPTMVTILDGFSIVAQPSNKQLKPLQLHGQVLHHSHLPWLLYQTVFQITLRTPVINSWSPSASWSRTTSSPPTMMTILNGFSINVAHPCNKELEPFSSMLRYYTISAYILNDMLLVRNSYFLLETFLLGNYATCKLHTTSYWPCQEKVRILQGEKIYQFQLTFILLHLERIKVTTILIFTSLYMGVAKPIQVIRFRLQRLVKCLEEDRSNNNRLP